MMTGNPLHGLNERQLDILHWLAEGLMNSEIAERVGLTTATVEKYVGHIFAALDVRNRVEAAVTYHVWCAR